MGKRMLSLCMTLALCLGLLPATALAADTEIGDWEIALPEEPNLTDTWLGSDEDGEPYYDISWYDANETEFELKSAEELAGLAALLLQSYNWQDVDAEMERPDDFPDGNDLENLKKANITLSGDIDLSAHSWVPIETFSGTFDGNEKTISHLSVTIGVTSYAGLFSYGSPTVKDVTLDNVYIVSDESSAGGIIGDARSNATIEGCKVSGTILYKGDNNDRYSVGGIAGEIASKVSVSDCTFSGTVYSQNYLWQTNGIGGIVGSTSGSTIENCTTAEGAKVCTGATNINAGGIVGYVTNGSVTDCTNHGTINTKSESDMHGVGGIVGQMYLTTASSDDGIKRCTNTGEITAAGDTTGGNIGGILGLQGRYSQGFSITNCHNSGAISLSGSTQCQVGGIAGGEINGTTIEQCSNTGAITVTASGQNGSAGGIAGKTAGGTVKISQCYNAVSVSIEGGSAGGLVGTAQNYVDTQISNCYNVGAVSGRNAAGAIGWLRLDMNGEHKLTLEGVFNAGTIAGTSQAGGLLGYQTTAGQVTNTLTNCSYWGNCGATGEGNALTSNQMTEDDAWSTNLGLDDAVWEKEDNPTDDSLKGYLPVLKENEQTDAPTLTRTKKLDQTPLTITGLSESETIYKDTPAFTLEVTGGSGNGAVTWTSDNEAVATVDSRGKVTIVGLGQVNITATKAEDGTYNEATASVNFTVNGRPIEKVFISNLVAPVEGANPVQYIDVPEDAPYKGMITAGVGGPSKLSVIWEDEAGNDVNVGETFQKDTVYIAVFRVKCDTYYSFSDQVRVVLENMNESAYSSITAKKDTQNPDNLIITVTFNATDHVHSWDTGNWTANPTHHWHACTAKDCPLKDPQGMGNYEQHTDNGSGTCSVCGQTIGYLITFNPNGGVCEIQNTRTDVNGALSSLPTPTRSGYTFLGWYTEDGTQVGEDTVFTQDTTLTAQWQYNAPPANPNYKITIEDTENGTVTANPAAAKAGETVTLTPTPDEGFDVGTVTVTDRFGDAVEVTANPDGTYTFTMPNGQVTVEVTFVESQPEPLPFTDVVESDWFYDAVRYAYENGLMGGVGDNLFAPNNPTTRAQLVTILYRLEGEPAVTGQSPFTDVEADTWYTDAVAWAAEEGVVNGVSETQFAPGNNITREQLATILFRYAQAKGYDVSPRADLSGFPDAGDILPYAREAMAWAVAEGLLQGFEDDTLRPQGNATRAQIATILMRFCEGVVE